MWDKEWDPLETKFLSIELGLPAKLSLIPWLWVSLSFLTDLWFISVFLVSEFSLWLNGFTNWKLPKDSLICNEGLFSLKSGEVLFSSTFCLVKIYLYSIFCIKIIISRCICFSYTFRYGMKFCPFPLLSSTSYMLYLPSPSSIFIGALLLVNSILWR